MAAHHTPVRSSTPVPITDHRRCRFMSATLGQGQ
jgi:hypothetical protein